MNYLKRVFVAVAACGMAAVAAQDHIVSWNVNAFGDAPVSGGAVAGQVPAGYWTDTWLNSNAVDLVDHAGRATTIDIKATSGAGTFYILMAHPGRDADGTLNREILNGYLNAGQNEEDAVSSVTLSQIGYETYDLYVYFSSDVAGRVGSVTDGTSMFYFNTLGAASLDSASGNAVFVKAAASTEAGYATGANYAVFRELSGVSQTVTVDIPAYGGIAAIQLVQIAEPEAAVVKSDAAPAEADAVAVSTAHAAPAESGSKSGATPETVGLLGAVGGLLLFFRRLM